jgi:hypothetical protein
MGVRSEDLTQLGKKMRNQKKKCPDEKLTKAVEYLKSVGYKEI